MDFDFIRTKRQKFIKAIKDANFKKVETMLSKDKNLVNIKINNYKSPLI